jgi:ribosome-binding factor A
LLGGPAAPPQKTHKLSLAALAIMEYQRSDRVGDLLVELIAELLSREIRDPRVRGVTITGAKVTKDLKLARVYFNVLGGGDNRDSVLAGLRSAGGFVRSRVGKELKLKFVPAIEFFYDETEDQAQRIDELLKKTKE